MSRYLRKAHGTDEIFMEKSVDSSDNEPTIPERKLFNTFDLVSTSRIPHINHNNPSTNIIIRHRIV